MGLGIVPAYFAIEGHFVEGFGIDLLSGEVVFLGEVTNGAVERVHARASDASNETKSDTRMDVAKCGIGSIRRCIPRQLRR